MRDIAIFGAGGFGREVACLIRMINESHEEPCWNLVGFFDDGIAEGTFVSHFGICLGGMDALNKWNTPLDVCVAIGRGVIVEKVVSRITNPMVEFPNVICPDFFVSDPNGFNIGKGNIVQGACAVTTDVTIGDFNVFNGSVVIGHDVEIANFNTFMPGVRISGEVKIGNRNLFGVYGVVLQCLTVKDDTTLAAGSVLMTKPKAGYTYIGVPAKKMDI